MLGPVICALLCAHAAASASEAQHVVSHIALRQAGHADGFVNGLGFKHRLRVCNAYPYASPLDVFRGSREKLTGEEPMDYKTCRDFSTQLKAGDKIEFKVGDASAGMFAVSDLPNNDAILLLVIHRHDTLSTAVSFESHVFANLLNAQVAIIDTYKGSAKAKPVIRDATAGKKSRNEQLRFNSVVAVNPGVYEVALDGKDGKALAKAELVALNRESYIVLRVGVEAQQGEVYPQDVVVFPKSDASALIKSSAVGAQVPASLLALVVAVITTIHLW